MLLANRRALAYGGPTMTKPNSLTSPARPAKLLTCAKCLAYLKVGRTCACRRKTEPAPGSAEVVW